MCCDVTYCTTAPLHRMYLLVTTHRHQHSCCLPGISTLHGVLTHTHMRSRRRTYIAPRNPLRSNRGTPRNPVYCDTSTTCIESISTVAGMFSSHILAADVFYSLSSNVCTTSGICSKARRTFTTLFAFRTRKSSSNGGSTAGCAGASTNTVHPGNCSTNPPSLCRYCARIPRGCIEQLVYICAHVYTFATCAQLLHVKSARASSDSFTALSPRPCVCALLCCFHVDNFHGT
uniref:Uncharacterized protein n=1 Tax=Lygus hesperus TaxID=30085 RepID=A0A146MBZ2_LYGHE